MWLGTGDLLLEIEGLGEEEGLEMEGLGEEVLDREGLFDKEGDWEGASLGETEPTRGGSSNCSSSNRTKPNNSRDECLDNDRKR